MGSMLTKEEYLRARRSVDPEVTSNWRAVSPYSRPGDTALFMRYSMTKGKTYRDGVRMTAKERGAATHIIVVIQRATGGKVVAQWRRRDRVWALVAEASAADLAEPGKAMWLLRHPQRSLGP